MLTDGVTAKWPDRLSRRCRRCGDSHPGALRISGIVRRAVAEHQLLCSIGVRWVRAEWRGRLFEDLDVLQERFGQLASGLPCAAAEKLGPRGGRGAFHHGVVEVDADDAIVGERAGRADATSQRSGRI